MGKKLIVHNADFSAVAVDTVNNVVTPLIQNGYAINTGGSIVANPVWAIYYVPIIRGMVYHLTITWNAGHYQRVGIANNVPSLSSSLHEFIVNQAVSGEATSSLDITYVANSNGYLCWQMHIEDTISCVITEK